MICVIVPCLCNPGMSVYVMKFEVCQECFVLSRVYVMKLEVCQD